MYILHSSQNITHLSNNWQVIKEVKVHEPKVPESVMWIVWTL